MRCLLAFFALLLALASPVLADDTAGKTALLQTLRSRNSQLDAMIIERFVTIKASPEIWAQMESEQQSNQFSFTNFYWGLAGTIAVIANNMGWGDVEDLAGKTSPDNPLVTAMLDRWNGKIAFTVDLSSGLDLKHSRQIVDNLTNVYAPLGYTSFKPRGGKALVTLTVDPAAEKLKVQVSGDGNTYFVTMPAYVRYVQYDLQAALKKGS